MLATSATNTTMIPTRAPPFNHVDGRHSLIVVPLATFSFPNVSLSYVSNVITAVAGTPSNALDPIVGGVSP